MTTLAVTDHDTVKGLARARAAADTQGIRLVPGIEVSTEAEGREIHILGHFVEPAEPGLASFSDRLGDERAERMGRMVERMNQLGFPVTLEEVKRIAAGAHLGRPHLALALVERGVVTSTREAFDRFLGDGKPGYVDRFRVSAEDAIAMLHRAGGTATLAHPGSSKVSPYTLEKLAKAGLDGLEIFHPDHVPSQRETFLRQAAALGPRAHRRKRLPRPAGDAGPEPGNGVARPRTLLATGGPGRFPSLTPFHAPSLYAPAPMSPDALAPYGPLLVVLLVAGGLGALVSVMSAILGPKRPSVIKSTVFEAGSEPSPGTARQRFAVKFYVVALLFIVFDVEAVFLYPWAVNFKALGWFGYVEMLVFAVTLVVGLAYVWKKGALEWES